MCADANDSLSGLAFLLAPAIRGLLASEHHPGHCIPKQHRVLLESALASSSSASASETTHAVLKTVSELMLLRPCMLGQITHLFRPILIDLVARWLLAVDIPIHWQHAGGLCPAHPWIEYPTHRHSPSGSAQKDDQNDSQKHQYLHEAVDVKQSPKHDSDGNILSSTSHTRPSDLDLPSRSEMLAAAISFLLPGTPQIHRYVAPLLSGIPGAFATLSGKVACHADADAGASPCLAKRLFQLVRALYRIVHHSPSDFGSLFEWQPYYLFLKYPDTHIQIYVAETLATVLGMADTDRQKLVEPILADAQDDSIRLIRLLEQEHDLRAQAEMFRPPAHDPSDPEAASAQFVTHADLCKFTVDLCGVLLPTASLDPSPPVTSPDTADTDRLVLTPTTRRNLHSMGLALSLGSPILLEGGPGTGKTSLVEEASRMTGLSDLLKIHLGDQTDSKVLLGTYVCTSTPGSFRWQPGVLTTAVSEGRWVLIEDIDLAPMEVVSVLIPLLETRHLFIPSRGEKFKAKEGFQLFATRTIFPSKSGGGRRVKADAIGDNLWTKLKVHPLPISEITFILETRFPSLREFIPGVIQSFEAMSKFYGETVGIGRYLSFRDLLKWCRRMSVLYPSISPDTIVSGEMNMQFREDLLREGTDCFAGMIGRRSIVDSVFAQLGAALGIPQHRIDFYIEHYAPSISTTEQRIVVGRGAVSVANNVTTTVQQRIRLARPFAETRHALKLLERLTVCTLLNEPTLLVGETGTGKTSVVQHLATLCGRKLVVVNMSQQSDSSDLLGGFKPVDAKMLASPIKEEFEALFAHTFSIKNNQPFLDSINKAYARKNWDMLLMGFQSAVKMAEKLFEKQRAQSNAEGDRTSSPTSTSAEVTDPQPPLSKKAKKNKPKKQLDEGLQLAWERFSINVSQFAAQRDQIQRQFLFMFVEGALVKAIKEGHWVLLDEINLATSETLECLSGLLQNASGSLLLLERGDTKPIDRHEGFRLFACMNPANDAGKRDLPPGLRSRFTEFWVDSPDSDPLDLQMIVRQYLKDHLVPGDMIVTDLAEFYQAAKLASDNKLYDGAGHRVHLSIRTLSRALTYGVHAAAVYGLRRGLYEGIHMTFGTQLGKESKRVMETLIDEHLLKSVRNRDAFLRQVPRAPSGGGDGGLNHVLFESFWLEKGNLEIPDSIPEYVLTPSVESNLRNLARAVMSQKYPVLIQGPTSAGKTSMIEYLAKRTGHRFVRINNHDHTDLQEYLGSYVPDRDGKLVFREGALVEALRRGYWIVLDELNLAPSDVLEALNRLLDDNRELLIPETQEIVRPHPHFMLFATQNPPGLYGGRKVLSRAFRNRFLELHFDDIPEAELTTILEQRCRIAPSYAVKLVAAYRELMASRVKSRVFEGKHGFVTLRDLFRWALREAVGYEELARNGFMILGERCRQNDEKEVVRQAIEKVMKVKLSMDEYYEAEFSRIHSAHLNKGQSFGDGVVWTRAMKKLVVMVMACISNKEPTLLVGETGCGKTTVCELLARASGRDLVMVNAHQHSETSDFLGSQRPVRGRDVIEREVRGILNSAAEAYPDLGLDIGAGSMEDLISQFEGFFSRQTDGGPADESISAALGRLQTLKPRVKALFEWHDGPLVQAMKKGRFFLLDEISLADDSVLERLNSVLEPSRLLVLAEKGCDSDGVGVEEIYGSEGFEFLATMNPGGDYGKKELSPALRNRFTEIWVPSVTDQDDLKAIITSKLGPQAGLSEDQTVADALLEFIDSFSQWIHRPRETVVSMRDILAWVQFMNVSAPNIGWPSAFVNGGEMVIVDGIGVNPLYGISGGGETSIELRKLCLEKLRGLVNMTRGQLIESSTFVDSTDRWGIEPFAISMGPHSPKPVQFAMKAPTTMNNCKRVLRALQLSKPILLEGSPGVGKTSLISSLASVTGHNLVRINLSEQTDLMDLFGSDLPVEGGSGGEFAWRDGPFLRAMQMGDWVLLDELNLASQQVLEGLNACLDHRAAVYIPELDRTFECRPGFRVFAAQNPQYQGGGRKGLPKSFVNRFTQVYVEALTMDDLHMITCSLNPDIDPAILKKMIAFNGRIQDEVVERCLWGWKGGPWEFNLRDVLRWVELMKSTGPGVRPNISHPGEYLEMVFSHRMRTIPDRERVRSIYQEYFGELPEQSQRKPSWSISPDWIQVGHAFLPRHRHRGRSGQVSTDHLLALHDIACPLESVMKAVEMGWMTLLTGPTASGKTSLVRWLAAVTGHRLEEFAMNSGVDTVELLGGFEQADLKRRAEGVLSSLSQSIEGVLRCLLAMGAHDSAAVDAARQLHADWDSLRSQGDDGRLDGSFVLSVIASLESVVNQLSLDLAASGLPTIPGIRGALEQYQMLSQLGVHGAFEWIDGTLLRAMENGHWVMIDNVNFCPASVLDRLNPLLEPNGVLLISERGLINDEVKVVKPHPDFRIFMTMDPKFGEVSRAMRNRAVEISLMSFNWAETDVSSERHAHTGADVLTILNSLGLPGESLPRLVHKTHGSVADSISALGLPANMAPDPKDLVTFGHFVVENVQRGIALQDALENAVRDVYLNPRGDVLDVDQCLITLRPLFADAQSAQMLSLGRWPHQPAGAILVDESHLGRVSVDGAHCLHSMLSDTSIPRGTTLVEAAGWYFVEHTSLQDLATRKAWLRYVGGLAPQSYMAEFLFKQLEYEFTPGSLLDDIVRLEQRTAEACSLQASLCSAQPVDLRGNSVLWKRLLKGSDQVHLYEYGLELLHIFRHVRFRRFVEERVYQASRTIKIGDLSVVQRSYALSSGRITESQLGHEIVRHLHPLFLYVGDMLLAMVEHCRSSISQAMLEHMRLILDRYDSLWLSVQSRDVDFSSLSICIKRLNKALAKAGVIANPQEDPLQRRLHQVVDAAARTLKLDSAQSNSAIWRHCRVSTLRYQDLADTESKLVSLDRRFDLVHQPLEDWILHHSLILDEAIKSSIVEGISTLYYLNEAPQSEQEQLLRVLESVHEQIQAKVEKDANDLEMRRPQMSVTTADDTVLKSLYPVPIPWLVEMSPRLAQLGVLPVHDGSALFREAQYVGILFELAEGSKSIDEIKSTLLQLVPDLSRYLAASLADTTRSPVSLEAWQRLIWICDSKSLAITDDGLVPFLRAILQDVVYKWSSALWHNATSVWLNQIRNPRIGSGLNGDAVALMLVDADSKTSARSPLGPSILCQGFNTAFFVHLLSSLSSTPIYSFVAKRLQAQQLLAHASSSMYGRDLSSERASLLLVLISSVIHYLEARYQGDRPSFAEIVLQKLRTARTSLRTGEAPVMMVADSLSELAGHPSASVDTPYLCKSLEQLQLAVPEPSLDKGKAASSKAWIYLGLAMLRAYVPEVPVDPAAAPAVKYRFAAESLARIESDIQVRFNMEQLCTGNKSNPAIERLVATRRELQELQTKLSARISLRPEHSQILEIFSDLRVLSTSALSDNSILSLLAAFDSADALEVENALQRELSLQETLAAYLERMEAKYPLYRDILQPVYVAVQQIRLGLKLLVSDINCSDVHLTDRAFSSLLCFVGDDLSSTNGVAPVIEGSLRSIRRNIQISQGQSDKKGKVHVQAILALMRRVLSSSLIRGAPGKPMLSAAHALMGELVDVWGLAEQRRVERQKEEDELFKYKQRSHDIGTEDELLEGEFKEIFPDFYGEYSDVIAAGLPPLNQEPDGDGKKDPSKDMDFEEAGVDEAFAVRHIHAELIDTWDANGCQTRPFEVHWNEAISDSYAVAGEILQLRECLPSRGIDFTAHGAHVFMARKRCLGLGTSEEQDGHYDFYKDANIPEAQKILPVLQSFDLRVSSLLDQWPDHTVLLQLLVIARRISAFAVTSPIMKLLTGLELLLQKCDDWESYASKEVSLKANMTEMTALIVEWRRLELRSWKQLLEVEDRRAQAQASKLWFHLYKVVIGVAMNSASEQTTDHNQDDALVKELLSTLDQLCLSSSLGEFAIRLGMINSFHRHLSVCAKHVPAGHLGRLTSVSDVLWNVLQYYSQFLPEIANTVERQRKPILKELHDYVKIATWKDVNVYALRESSNRTHHHLHKFVKKYREILAQSVTDTIRASQQSVPLDGGKSVHETTSAAAQRIATTLEHTLSTETTGAVPTQPPWNGTRDVSQLMARMQKLSQKLGTQISASIETANGIDDVAGSILQRIQEFQDANATLDPASKAAKGQKALRKKALVDLLKYLAHLGLSSRCIHKYMYQREYSYVYSLPAAQASQWIELLGKACPSGLEKDLGSLWTKANDYYFRLLARTAVLREGAFSWSSDLTDREVERTVSNVEHLLHLIMEERRVISEFGKELEAAGRYVTQIQALVAPTETGDAVSMLPAEAALEAIEQSKTSVDELVVQLRQTRMLVKAHHFAEAATASDMLAQIDKCIESLAATKSKADAWMCLLDTWWINQASAAAVPNTVLLLLKQSQEAVGEIVYVIDQVLARHPETAYILSPLRQAALGHSQRLQRQPTLVSDAIDPASSDLVSVSGDKLVDAILIAFQELRMSPTNSVPENKAPAPGADGAAGNEADEFGLSQGFILDEHQKFLKVFKASPLANVVTAIQSVLTPPNMGSAVAVEGLHSSSVALRHICPLLKQYLAAAEYRMCELMVYHKSINKLAYILCNTFALLLKNGFCVPQASDDSAEGETEDNVDGTGIGEGEGNKDVSDQIDNPEQVEGTQNEQKQQPSGEPVPEEENALEMDEDFDGQIEDVKREAGDDDDDKDDDDEEENDAAEEQMGELDRDEADVVDEKLWGDDDDDQIDKDNEKTEKNASVDSKGGETETVAKDESGPDDEQPPEPKDEAEKREQDSKRNADNGSEASDDESDHVNDIEDAFEDSHGVDIKDRDQPEEPDGDDDMDLPEDMNLDGDGDENENENDDDDDGHNDMEIDRPDDDAKPRDDEKNVGDNGDADSSDEEAADEADDGEGDDHVDQIEDQLDESPTEQPGDRSDNDESSQQPDEPEEPEEPEAPDEAADPANNSMQPHGGEDPAADEQDESEAKEDDTKAVDDREQSRAEQPHGVEGQAGQVSNIQSSEPTTGEGTGADNQAADDSFEHADASEAKPTQRPAASQQQKQKPRKPDPNPRRSLGDALKNWMSRLKSISESSQDRAEEPQQSEQNEQPQVDGDQAMDYEFVQNDDEAADAQALDAATSEQMSQMDQKALADDEEEDNYAKQDEEMQVDDQPAEETPAFEKKPDQRSNDNQNVSGTLPNRQKESDDSADAETRPAGEDLAADEDHDDGDGDDARDNLASTDDQSRRQRQDPQSDEDMGDTSDEHDEAELSYEELRQNLEKSVADWRQSGQDLREAETLWKNYTNLTQNLAFELCEQLRLILEPTLATKLKGDYRTGKRLNMRKVIPYIASQFKKDKIWMRRTKPSKRTYQILIAIDDSQSMAETRSVQMAYESLALISKALTQLEVGDLGIVSFGESVRLVHPFERPFSDDAGAEVLRRFTFSQGRTNVRTMMDTAIEVLDHARLVTATAPGADELWQLQIIISDGICEDHEKIKALVRKAAENRIMVVFLVLDNRPEKDSIVKMTNVTYGTDSKTGRPTLQMSKYMDTFPFDYYVMLRDINRLPEVLSDTLRQYFSFVSA